MTPLDRVISRVHWEPVVSTIRVPATSLTSVARSSAGPTAVFQANVTLPSDNGAVRRSSISAAGTTWLMGRINPSYHRGDAAGAGVGVASSSGFAEGRRIRVRHAGGRSRRARPAGRSAGSLRAAARDGEVGARVGVDGRSKDLRY